MLYQLSSNISFNGGLKDNLRIGEKVLREFKGEFPATKSPTLLRHKMNKMSSRLQDRKPERFEELYNSYQKRLMQTRDEIESVLDDVERRNPTLENRIKGIERVVQEKGFANCGECANILQFKFIEKGEKAHNVVMSIKDTASGIEKKDGDHVFTVIGLSKNAKLDNPRTWGPQAVIVDSWRNMVMGARDALNELQNFLGAKPLEHNVVYRSADHIDAAIRLNKMG